MSFLSSMYFHLNFFCGLQVLQHIHKIFVTDRSGYAVVHNFSSHGDIGLAETVTSLQQIQLVSSHKIVDFFVVSSYCMYTNTLHSVACHKLQFKPCVYTFTLQLFEPYGFGVLDTHQVWL